MGVLLKCRDERRQIDVAVKVLGWNFSNQEVIRFQQEAQALAQLRHPNIVNIIHFGHSDDDSLFIVMELLQGNTLDKVIDCGELQFEEALNAFIQICDGLAHAHGKGILHRDIKPSNLFLERKPNGSITVTITDFGLAKLLTEDQRLTKTGIGLGSPPYMSPEQIDGKMVDDRADIYGLGCVMFEVLTGRRPFIGPSVQSILLQHTNSEPPLLREQFPDKNFPEEIDEIVSKCLKKNPDQRYETVLDLRNDLQKLKGALAQSYAVSESKTVPQPVLKISDSKQSFTRTLLTIIVILIPVIALVSVSLNKFLEKENPKTATSEILKSGVADSLRSSIANGELKFDLKDQPITDEQMKDFAGCTTAEFVELSGTEVTDSGLQYLGSARNLQKLLLNDTAVRTLEYLPVSDSLRELQLKGTRITDQALQNLKNFRHLAILDVRDTRITADGIIALKEEKLAAVKMNNLNDTELARLREALPFCMFNEHLSFSSKFENELDQLLTLGKGRQGYDRCLKWTRFAKERGDKDLQLFSMTLTAQCLDAYAKNKEAGEIWKEALAFGETEGLKLRLLTTYKRYLDRSYLLKKTDEVLKYGKRYVDLNIEVGDQARVPDIIDAVGWRFAQLGRVQEGIDLTRKAVSIQKQRIARNIDGTTPGAMDDDADSPSKQLALIRYQTHLANSQSLARQFDDARKTMAEVRAQLDQIDETFAAQEICVAYLCEAQIEMDMKNYKKGLEWNDKAMNIIETRLSNRNEVLFEAFGQRKDLLIAVGRKQEALIFEAELKRMAMQIQERNKSLEGSK